VSGGVWPQIETGNIYEYTGDLTNKHGGIMRIQQGCKDVENNMRWVENSDTFHEVEICSPKGYLILGACCICLHLRRSFANLMPKQNLKNLNI
jgi:hypothetical protein